MASKRRLRRNGCTGKVQYKTVKEATAAKYRVSAIHGWQHAYRCKFCGFWHIGH